MQTIYFPLHNRLRGLHRIHFETIKRIAVEPPKHFAVRVRRRHQWRELLRPSAFIRTRKRWHDGHKRYSLVLRLLISDVDHDLDSSYQRTDNVHHI